MALPDVDLRRYSGVWFEAARLPNPFERDCVTSRAEYQYSSATNSLSVVNTCTTGDGRQVVAAGYAVPVGQGRLYVNFGRGPPDPVERAMGNYWILDIDPCYSQVVVGSPGTNYAWVLTRTPEPDPADVQRAIDMLHIRWGFDTSCVTYRGTVRP